MTIIKCFVWLSLFSCSFCHLTEFYRWKQLKYQHLSTILCFVRETHDDEIKNNHEQDVVFPGDIFHEMSEDNEEFIPYNNVPMSVAHYKDKLIITVPRRKPGIPSTLNYVSTNLPQGSSPSLRPYPDAKTNKLHPHLHPDKNRIVSVYRPRVDNCGRLWFVDTGTLQYTFPENPNKTIHMLQRPSIWVIDMKTDELVERFEMPEMPGHGLVSITVDVGSKKCGDAFAYIPDLLTFRLHVYSLRRNKMWSFEHPSFKFEEQYASFDVDSFQYTWRDGIFSIALGDRENDGYRAAYYHPMASLSEYKVNTRVLQNKAASKRLNHGDDFQKIGERGFKSQCTMHSLDRHTGVIMFAEVAKNGVSCWNSYKPLHKGNIQLIDKDDVKMIYPVDLNIDRDGIMWMVTNTMQRFIYGKLDPNTYNFRIWRANVSEVTRGTVCEVEHFVQLKKLTASMIY